MDYNIISLRGVLPRGPTDEEPPATMQVAPSFPGDRVALTVNSNSKFEVESRSKAPPGAEAGLANAVRIWGCELRQTIFGIAEQSNEELTDWAKCIIIPDTV
jgi:hypothetical protein